MTQDVGPVCANRISMFWKMKRARWRHIGAKVSSGRPLAGTRASGIKKTMNGQVLDRRTGKPLFQSRER